MDFKNLFKKNTERSARLKQLQEERLLQRIVEDREKSSNERELERFQKENREREIKAALEIMRKQRHKEAMTSSILNDGNQFGGKPTMMRNNKKLFSAKQTLDKQKGGMFFK